MRTRERGGKSTAPRRFPTAAAAAAAAQRGRAIARDEACRECATCHQLAAVGAPRKAPLPERAWGRWRGIPGSCSSTLQCPPPRYLAGVDVHRDSPGRGLGHVTVARLAGACRGRASRWWWWGGRARSRSCYGVARLFVVALFLLIVTSPLVIFSALLIKCSDKGPIFYTQVRTGLHGNPFRIEKLRSMRVDAKYYGA